MNAFETLKRLALRAPICILLAFVLAVATPVSAFADVLGDDVIGTSTVTERGLTITQAPDVGASYGILMDADGTILWSRSADSESAMASITKMMTAVVVLENLEPSDVITIPEEAVTVGESSAGLVAGEEVTVEDLLKALLVHSGNDAAIALAIGVSGSVDAFVELMNAKATEIGMTDTVFENPHGLDQGDHHSTAADLALLARYAMKKELFREIVAMDEVEVDFGSGSTTFESTNKLLDMMDGAIGVKTGYTDDAGYCLASAAVEGDIELYAVVLGCDTENARFTDSQTLLEWGFEHYNDVTLAEAGDTLATVPSLGWIDVSIPATVAETVVTSVLDYNGAVDQTVTLLDISESVKEGDCVGTITWTQGATIIATAKLVAQGDVDAPNIFEKIGIALRRAWRSIFGGSMHSEAQILVEDVTISDPLPNDDEGI